MPTTILTRVVELANVANPFVFTSVSRGFKTAVADYVDGVYEADERLHAIEKADYRVQRDVQHNALAASPSLRAVCATQIQQAAACFLARRHAMWDAARRDEAFVMYSTSLLLRLCSVSTEPLKIGSVVSP